MLQRQRSRVEMTRQSLTRSSLLFLRQLAGHEYPIDACAYNSTRHHIVTSDMNSMRIWSLRKELRRIPMPKVEGSSKAAQFVNIIYYEAEDLYLGACLGDPQEGLNHRSYSGYILGYTAGLVPVIEFPGHRAAEIVGADMDQTRQELITCDVAGTINIWVFTREGGASGNEDLRAFHRDSIQVIENERVTAFTFCGSESNSCGLIIVASSNGMIKVIELVSLKVILTYQARTQEKSKNVQIQSVCFAPDSIQLLIGYDDGSVDFCTITENILSPDLGGGKQLVEMIFLSTFDCHTAAVNDISLVEGVPGAISCGMDSVVRHWKLSTSSEIGRYQHVTKPPLASHIPPNKKLKNACIKRIVPVKLNISAMCSKQLLLVLSGELITLLEILSPCLPFAESNATILSIQPVPGPDPPIEFNPKLDRCNLERRRHHIVSFSQNRTVLIHDAVNGEGAFSFNIPCRREYEGIQVLPNGQPVALLPTLRDGRNLNALVTCYQWLAVPSLHAIGWSDGKIDLYDSNADLQHSLVDKTSLAAVQAFCSIQISGPVAKKVHDIELKNNRLISDTQGYQPLRADSSIALASRAMPENAAFKLLQKKLDKFCKPDPFSRALKPAQTLISVRRAAQEQKQMEEERLLSPIELSSSSYEGEDQRLRERTNTELIVGSFDGSVRLWHVETSQLVKTIRAHSGPVLDVLCVNPVEVSDPQQIDPQNLPLLRYVLTAGIDGFVKMWSTKDLELIGFTYVHSEATPTRNPACGGSNLDSNGEENRGARSNLSCIHLIPDSGIFICGFENGIVQSWNIPIPPGSGTWGTNVPFKALFAPHSSCRVHTKRVTQLSSSQLRQDTFLSASMDHTVMIWKVDKHGVIRQLRRLTFPAAVETACFSPICDEIVLSWGTSVSIVSSWESLEDCETSESVQETTKVDAISENSGTEAIQEEEEGLLCCTIGPVSGTKPKTKCEAEGSNFDLPLSKLTPRNLTTKLTVVTPKVGNTESVGYESAIGLLMPVQVRVLKLAFEQAVEPGERQVIEPGEKQVIKQEKCISVIESLGWQGVTLNILQNIAKRNQIDFSKKGFNFATMLRLTNAFIVSPEAEQLMARPKSSGVSVEGGGKKRGKPKRQLRNYSKMCTKKGVVQYNALGEKCTVVYKDVEVVSKMPYPRAISSAHYTNVPSEPFLNQPLHIEADKDTMWRSLPEQCKSLLSLQYGPNFYSGADVTRIKKIPEAQLLKIIRQIIREKMVTDALAVDEGRTRVSLWTSVLEWHLRNLGSGESFRRVIIERLFSLIKSIQFYSKQYPICRSVARFLHIGPDKTQVGKTVGSIGSTGVNIYVDTLRVIHSTNQGTSTSQKLPLKSVLEAFQFILQKPQEWSLLSSIERRLCQFQVGMFSYSRPTLVETLESPIDEEQALELAIDEYVAWMAAQARAVEYGDSDRGTQQTKSKIQLISTHTGIVGDSQLNMLSTIATTPRSRPSSAKSRPSSVDTSGSMSQQVDKELEFIVQPSTLPLRKCKGDNSDSMNIQLKDYGRRGKISQFVTKQHVKHLRQSDIPDSERPSTVLGVGLEREQLHLSIPPAELSEEVHTPTSSKSVDNLMQRADTSQSMYLYEESGVFGAFEDEAYANDSKHENNEFYNITDADIAKAKTETPTAPQESEEESTQYTIQATGESDQPATPIAKATEQTEGEANTPVPDTPSHQSPSKPAVPKKAFPPYKKQSLGVPRKMKAIDSPPQTSGPRTSVVPEKSTKRKPTTSGAKQMFYASEDILQQARIFVAKPSAQQVGEKEEDTTMTQEAEEEKEEPLVQATEVTTEKEPKPADAARNYNDIDFESLILPDQKDLYVPVPIDELEKIAEEKIQKMKDARKQLLGEDTPIPEKIPDNKVPLTSKVSTTEPQNIATKPKPANVHVDHPAPQLEPEDIAKPVDVQTLGSPKSPNSTRERKKNKRGKKSKSKDGKKANSKPQGVVKSQAIQEEKSETKSPVEPLSSPERATKKETTGDLKSTRKTISDSNAVADLTSNVTKTSPPPTRNMSESDRKQEHLRTMNTSEHTNNSGSIQPSRTTAATPALAMPHSTDTAQPENINHVILNPEAVPPSISGGELEDLSKIQNEVSSNNTTEAHDEDHNDETKARTTKKRGVHKKPNDVEAPKSTIVTVEEKEEDILEKPIPIEEIPDEKLDTIQLEVKRAKQKANLILELEQQLDIAGPLKIKHREVQVDGETMVSKSNCFGEPIYFEPLNLMKQQASIPHWHQSQNFDAAIEADIPVDILKGRGGYIEMGNLDFLYNENDQDEELCEVQAPDIGNWKKSWGEFFKKMARNLMAPEPELEVEETDVEREERRIREMKKILETTTSSHVARAHWRKLRVMVKMNGMWRHQRKLRLRQAESGKILCEELQLGKAVQGRVHSEMYCYYKFDLLQADRTLTISLSSPDGDPDVYLSDTTLPTTKDFRWRTSAIGSRRIILCPGDRGFVAGKYFISVFSLTAARFELLVETQNIEYGSAPLDHVTTLTRKFESIVENKQGLEADSVRDFTQKKTQFETHQLCQSANKGVELKTIQDIEEENEPGNGALDNIFTNHENDQDEAFERLVVELGRREMRAGQFEFEIDDDDEQPKEVKPNRPPRRQTRSSMKKRKEKKKPETPEKRTEEEQAKLEFKRIQDVQEKLNDNADALSVSTVGATSYVSEEYQYRTTNTRYNLTKTPKKFEYCIGVLANQTPEGLRRSKKEISRKVHRGGKHSAYQVCSRAYVHYQDNTDEKPFDRLAFALHHTGIECEKNELLEWVQELGFDDGIIPTLEGFIQVYEHVQSRVLKKAKKKYIESKKTRAAASYYEQPVRPVALGVGPKISLDCAQLENPKESDIPFADLSQIYSKSEKDLERARKKAKARSVGNIRQARRKRLIYDQIQQSD